MKADNYAISYDTINKEQNLSIIKEVAHPSWLCHNHNDG